MTSVDAPSAPQSARRWASFSRHWMTRVLGIYVLSRIVCMVTFWYSWTRFDREDYPIPDGVTFPVFLARAWDGKWYGIIAEDGYPAELPTDADGNVEYSPWAFFPLFPLLARMIMRVTGLPWEVVGPGLSVVLGAVAMLMLFKVIHALAPDLVVERPALPYSAVAVMSFFPAAGAFSMAYSDSLALVLVLACLWCIGRRRYVLAIVPVVLLGFTRAVALPMAAVVIWHLACRCHRDGLRSVPAKDWWAAAGLFLIAVGSGFSWMVVTGIALGSPDGYFQAQSAWRQGEISTAPFAGWTWYIDTWVGWLAFAVFCFMIVTATFTPFVRRLGPELQAWGGAYAGFLIAASALGPSTPRYIMMIVVFPLIMTRAKRGFRGDLNVIVTMAVLMVVWIHLVFTVEGFTA